MKVYIAGRYEDRFNLNHWAKHLERMTDHQVISTWHSQTRDSLPFEECASEAFKDLKEIYACDIFIVDTTDFNKSGGRWVEMGVAMAAKKRVIAVGPVANIFVNLVEKRNNWFEVINLLEEECKALTRLKTVDEGKSLRQGPCVTLEKGKDALI